MARSIWKGSLTFGLVSIPVGLYPATTDMSLHFHQLEAGTSDRIRYKKVNERTGKEVGNDKIDKAMDVGGGEYVVVSDEELEAAAPKKSRTIEIDGFVDLNDIDPIYYRTTYYLAPTSGAGTKAYNLLREAMEKAGKVGIASFVMRNKEYLVAIRPEEGIMALETMYFADEVRDPADDLPNLSEDMTFTAKERDMARTLIESLGEKWDPSEHHDSYREQVRALIEQRHAGHQTLVHTEPEEGGKVIDLLQALQASVNKASGSSGKGTATRAAPARRTAAKRRTATGGRVTKKTTKPPAKRTRKAS